MNHPFDDRTAQFMYGICVGVVLGVIGRMLIKLVSAALAA